MGRRGFFETRTFSTSTVRDVKLHENCEEHSIVYQEMHSIIAMHKNNKLDNFT
jgi:hypothetical protein